MAGWTSRAGKRTLGTLIVEAFGQFSEHRGLSDIIPGKENLLGVFDARGEAMRWSPSGTARPLPHLWYLEEAELTASVGNGMVGWVQVGVDVEPTMALPPLIQCLDDSLRRFGEVELSALQMTARRLLRQEDLPIPNIGWFGESLGPRTRGVIACDARFVETVAQPEFVEKIRGWNSAGVPSGRFEFAPVAAAQGDQAIRDPAAVALPADRALSPADWVLPVTMPEWSPSSVAWALCTFIDTIRRDADGPRDFAVRLTRVS